MKFLHTADWHIGKTLKGRSRLKEQRAVLAEIVQIALDNEVDAVLVAGDLYDTAAPSPDAQRLVNTTLLKLAQSGVEVVVIAGNHDHGRTFEALRGLMAAVGIQYAGGFHLADEGGVHRFTARSTGEQAVVALIPFVSRRYIVGAEEIVTGQPSENAGRYEDSVREIIGELSGEFTADSVNIVMGHLTCTGGALGGGEREAQTIFEYHVSAHTFPLEAHYVALGHLHRRQQIPASCPVHYSGSPIAVDFGEVENTSVVCLVEATPDTPAEVTDVPITSGKRLRTVTGTFAELKAAAATFGDDYLKVIVREPLRAGLRDAVMDVLPNALEVRIHPDFQEASVRHTVQHASRSPHDLFVAYCEESGIDDPRLTALFDELLDETSK